MSEEQEKQVIVCMPWGEHYTDSVRMQCFQCGSDIALDAQNRALIEDCSIQTICLPCYRLRGYPQPQGALIQGRMIRFKRPENN